MRLFIVLLALGGIAGTVTAQTVGPFASQEFTGDCTTDAPDTSYDERVFVKDADDATVAEYRQACATDGSGSHSYETSVTSGPVTYWWRFEEGKWCTSQANVGGGVPVHFGCPTFTTGQAPPRLPVWALTIVFVP